MSNVLAILDQNKPTLQALASINLPAGVNAEALVLQSLTTLNSYHLPTLPYWSAYPTLLYTLLSLALKQPYIDPSAGLVYVKHVM